MKTSGYYEKVLSSSSLEYVRTYVNGIVAFGDIDENMCLINKEYR